jgi:hypothetical protein
MIKAMPRATRTATSTATVTIVDAIVGVDDSRVPPTQRSSHVSVPGPQHLADAARGVNGDRPGHNRPVLALVWFDVVGLIGIVAACGGLYYLSSRIEPHWVAKDRTRFLTVAQELDVHGLPVGRRRDVRVHLDDESEALLVSTRSLLRPSSGMWTVKSRSASRHRNVYVLRPASPSDAAGLLALRVPQKSSVVARLDELLEITGDEAVARRERLRYRADGTLADPTAASDSQGSPPLDPPTDRG